MVQSILMSVQLITQTIAISVTIITILAELTACRTLALVPMVLRYRAVLALPTAKKTVRLVTTIITN